MIRSASKDPVPARANHAVRLRQLRAAMERDHVPALLATHLPDVRYLSGFTGSNAALAITASEACLFTDGRYTTQAAAEVRSAAVAIVKGGAAAEAAKWLIASGAKQVFYDGTTTTVAALSALETAVKAARKGSKGSESKRILQALREPLVANQRVVKDGREIELMAAAAALGVKLFDHILGVMRPGMTETAVAAELEYRARLAGAEGMSFATIVASGERSALPHGTASTAKLPRRGFVTLDFGVILNGYCSDMTRTVHLGRASHEERSAYDAVLAAQEQAVECVKAGIAAADVDHAARRVLEQAGLAEYFTHSTGHGVGLEIHEAPRIGVGQQTLLSRGMVITIEPGVYMPGAFGVRIEDTVVVEPRGARVLTPATKAWIEL